MRAARPLRLVSRVLAVTLLAAGALQVVAAPAQASYPVPPTPAGLPSAIEDYQSYVGQTLCDPVAKPGVSAFRDLLLHTYAGTTSLGIVRDCGVGGQSEHKEGRAFDWGVSVTNTTQAAQANTLLAWLLKTDAQGHPAAMARRFGIMYMIWNRHIWKAYQASQGWQAYSGADPHTGHVHFSFGWSGAKRATSYWTKTVAAFDPGPAAPVVPVRTVANLTVVRTYGATTLKAGSTGTAVAVVQRALRLVVDSSFGSQTVAAVKRFQSQQGMTVTGTFGPAEWKQLFPAPINPFGGLDPSAVVPGATRLSGWALDVDTSSPVSVNVTVDGTQVASTSASLPRGDVATRYPGFGTGHGFQVDATLAEGSHKVCATAVNVSGTPGVDAALPCRTITVTHVPSGALEKVAQTLGNIAIIGWTVDPDTAAPASTAITVDGAAPISVSAAASRPDVATAWPGFGATHGLATQAAAAEGTHHVCVTAVNAGMGTDKPLGCRDVTVRHTPDGVFDAGLRPGGLAASGWGLDPDVAAAVPVTLTVDGTQQAPLSAALARPDIPASYAANGTGHGFSTMLNLPQGPHTLCAAVSNADGTPGAETPLGCHTVTALHDAQGRLEAVRTIPGGSVVISGWALDPDVAASSGVQLSIDGSTRTVTASVARADVAASWPGFGAARGFSSTLAMSTGWHKVCATALNVRGTAGANLALGCRSVLLGTPHGAIDPLRAGTGSVLVSGWTIDPDVITATYVQISVDGVLTYNGRAALTRSGFAAIRPGYGTAHGFRVTVRAAKGNRRVCVTAVNVANTRGANRTFSCTTVTVL